MGGAARPGAPDGTPRLDGARAPRHRVLDLGKAYAGGVEAWSSGHPERVHTWMSTTFLAMIMALVSRLMSMAVAEGCSPL